MNYVGKKVKQAVFGIGEIISQDEGNRVSVRFFDDSVREFVAPPCSGSAPIRRADGPLPMASFVISYQLSCAI